jgi:hypothetical protein
VCFLIHYASVNKTRVKFPNNLSWDFYFRFLLSFVLTETFSVLMTGTKVSLMWRRMGNPDILQDPCFVRSRDSSTFSSLLMQ